MLNPNTVGMWDIDVFDNTSFMHFVFEKAPPGSVWVIEDWIPAFTDVTFLEREAGATKDWGDIPAGHPDYAYAPSLRVILSDSVRAQLLSRLSEIGVDKITHQSVYAGDNPFMVPYDNLSACMLSSTLSEGEVEEAGKHYGFAIRRTA